MCSSASWRRRRPPAARRLLRLSRYVIPGCALECESSRILQSSVEHAETTAQMTESHAKVIVILLHLSIRIKPFQRSMCACLDERNA